jgi:AraC family transcriptional regulator
MLTPEIVQKPAMRFIGLEVSFLHGLSPVTTAPKVIPPLWDKFAPLGGQVPGRIGHAMYGIIYGRPESERSHKDELQYIAAVEVGPEAGLLAGMVERTVPAGTFAVFVHRGPIHKIKETCYEIYRVWLPASPYKHAEIADIELYDDRFCAEGAESEMEYWISIVPR